MKLNNKFLLKVLIFGLILLVASKILQLFKEQNTIISRQTNIKYNSFDKYSFEIQTSLSAIIAYQS